MTHPPHSISFMPDDLCKVFPFLRQLPLGSLREIDITNFHIPTGAIAKIRSELEDRLGCCIMTYRTTPLASSGQEKLHLCQLLVPACLTPAQLEELKKREVAYRAEGVIFVAYQNPLQLRTSSNLGTSAGDR